MSTNNSTNTDKDKPTKAGSGSQRVCVPASLKEKIVVLLGEGFAPSEVVLALKDEHKLSRQQVMKFDPRTVSGSNLSAELRNLFYAVHEKAQADLLKHSYAHTPQRVAFLTRQIDEALAVGNRKLALAAMAEIRKNTQTPEIASGGSGDSEDDELWIRINRLHRGRS